MSTFYIEEKNEGTLLTFNKKILYNEDTINQKYPNLVDFNFGEKFFYGRVDFRFKPIYFSNSSIPIKHFKGSQGNGEQIGAASFVVDAFDDLTKQFQKKASIGEIQTDDPFLSTLKVYKAFSDPRRLYDKHLGNYMSAMAKQFKEQKIEVRNFEEFMFHFKELIQRSAREFPFTMAAYIKSKYCPIYATGLALEIADAEYFNDEEKIQKFVNSKNWEFYLNACNSYGFMVDKAIPWRLVADIASNEMLTYASKYGAGTTGQVLSIGYNNTFYEFVIMLRTYMLRVYNMVRLESVLTLEECNGQTVSRYVTPKKYKIADVEGIVSETELLKLYFNIRFVEESNRHEPSKKQKIIRDCLSIRNSRSLLHSLLIFEEIINQPFDYHGSLSYLYRQSKMGIGGKIVLSNT